jgi:hypothetical protein
MDDRLRGPDVRHDPRRRARGASARAAAGADALQQLPGRHQDAPHGVPLAAAPCPAKPADLGFSFSPSTKDAIVIRLKKKGSGIKVIVLITMLTITTYCAAAS